MCSTWLLHIYTQLTFHKRSNLTICYLIDDGYMLATARMIYYWVVPKKNHTPPTEEISATKRGRGESYKEYLKFVQDVHKREGRRVLLISSMGGIDMEQPIF